MSDTVGNALNMYGKFTTFMWLAVALSLLLVSSSIGVIIFAGPQYKNQATGVVESITCTGNVCAGNVLINGSSIYITGIPPGPTKGSTINVYYTDEPSPRYSGTATPPKSLGISLILSGLVLVLCVIVVGSMVRKSRTASQVVGGVTLVDQIRGTFFR